MHRLRWWWGRRRYRRRRVTHLVGCFTLQAVGADGGNVQGDRLSRNQARKEHGGIGGKETRCRATDGLIHSIPSDRIGVGIPFERWIASSFGHAFHASKALGHIRLRTLRCFER